MSFPVSEDLHRLAKDQLLLSLERTACPHQELCGGPEPLERIRAGSCLLILSGFHRFRHSFSHRSSRSSSQSQVVGSALQGKFKPSALLGTAERNRGLHLGSDMLPLRPCIQQLPR